MSEHMMGQEATELQDNVLKAVAPFQAAWQKAFFDLPLTLFSETIRFAGQRLQAQGDFIASLRTCHTVPEAMEAQSRFVRATVDEYGVETSKIMEEVRTTVNKAA